MRALSGLAFGLLLVSLGYGQAGKNLEWKSYHAPGEDAGVTLKFFGDGSAKLTVDWTPKDSDSMQIHYTAGKVDLYDINQEEGNGVRYFNLGKIDGKRDRDAVTYFVSGFLLDKSNRILLLIYRDPCAEGEKRTLRAIKASDATEGTGCGGASGENPCCPHKLLLHPYVPIRVETRSGDRSGLRGFSSDR